MDREKSARTVLAVLSVEITWSAGAWAAGESALAPGARIRARVTTVSADGRSRVHRLDGAFVSLSDSTLTMMPTPEFAEAPAARPASWSRCASR